MLEMAGTSNYRWELDDGILRSHMMVQTAAAPEFLNDLLCKCDDCSAECIYEVNQQQCTSECACGTSLPKIDEDSYCHNPPPLAVIGQY